MNYGTPRLVVRACARGCFDATCSVGNMISSDLGASTPPDGAELTRRSVLMLAAGLAATSLVNTGHACPMCVGSLPEAASLLDTSSLQVYNANVTRKVSFSGPHTTPSPEMQTALLALFKSFSEQASAYQMEGLGPLQRTLCDEIGHARRAEVRRAVWDKLRSVPEFKLTEKPYSAEAYDQFMMGELPSLLAPHGIMMHPYIHLVGDKASTRFSHVDLRANFYLVESAHIGMYDNGLGAQEAIEEVIVGESLTVQGQPLSSERDFSAMAVWDSMFVKRSSVTAIVADFGTPTQEMLTFQAQIRSLGLSDDYTACLQLVANTRPEEKENYATFAALYLCWRGLQEKPITVEQVFANEFAHEAGHIFAFRRGVNFNYLRPEQISDLESAQREELNRASHHEAAGYFRQLQHGHMYFTLFGFLKAIYAVQKPTGTLQHTAAKQSVLRTIEDNLLVNAQAWGLPINTSNPYIPATFQARMLLPIIAGQQPESLALLVARIGEDHLVNAHTADWGTTLMNILKQGSASAEPTRATSPAQTVEAEGSKGWLWGLAGIISLGSAAAAWLRTRDRKST